MRTLLVLALLAGTAAADPPFVYPPYDQLGQLAKAQLSEARYRALVADTSVRLTRMEYRSGGLRVVAIACHPASAGKKPLLLWLHGGAGDGAKIGADNFDAVVQIRKLCAAGHVVLAPQYRGADGGEGTDEVGGGDLDDVLALIPLARAMPDVDAARTFVWGSSRGAVMALMAIRAKAPVTAAVVVGCAGDFADTLRRLPAFATLVPASARTPAGIERRSPIRWVGELADVPILFLHGADDPAVPAAGMLALASKLADAGGLYEVHVLAREDHAMWRPADEVLARSLDWFANVRKRSAAHAFDDELARAGTAAAARRVRALWQTARDRYDFGERELTVQAYTYLGQRRAPDAVALFELIAELYPASANAWDSLGDGYAAAQRTADAIRAYEKSLALDPKNGHARGEIARLRRP
jgi:dienelactone hydrolase